MAWWKDANERRIPSPAEVKAMMGFGPDPAAEEPTLQQIAGRSWSPQLRLVGVEAPDELARLVGDVFDGVETHKLAFGQCVGIAHDCHCVDCEIEG